MGSIHRYCMVEGRKGRRKIMYEYVDEWRGERVGGYIGKDRWIVR